MRNCSDRQGYGALARRRRTSPRNGARAQPEVRRRNDQLVQVLVSCRSSRDSGSRSTSQIPITWYRYRCLERCTHRRRVLWLQKEAIQIGHKRVGGQWRAFIDACPHRKVPLSEGRVEDDGSLLCSYHAWRFDGQGALVNIPQLEKEDDLERIKADPKSNCNAFPTKNVDGLLWVWPDAGDDARLESALKEPPTCNTPQGVDQDRLWIGHWNFRELAHGTDYFIENVVDPAHVEVR
jgi:nitrite reductase/ring-hydroxylating ferredoxin subunit